MKIKLELNISNTAILNNLNRLTNQIYKLLPTREEGLDWQMPLHTIIEELSGMCDILSRSQELLFSLICKLQGLLHLTTDEENFYYRRTIFECLTLINKIKSQYKGDEE